MSGAADPAPGRRGGTLLVAGTTSDAGKSVLTTGLCRALARRGCRVAPFKAQNMSNNSMVTADGAEIGRAQWIQAVAARAEPEAAMNPVLLKPGSDRRSHVVVMGRPHGELEAGQFATGRSELARAAHAAFDDLTRRYDVVVCEGAGSPAEINLRAGDYVNMGLARHARIPTVLVGDIDRGGVLAAMYGTLALLDDADQALVSGFVVNKFRGDVGLLRPGLVTLEGLTGRPVLGVLPWLRGLWLDSEDSLAGTAEARFSVEDGDGVAEARFSVEDGDGVAEARFSVEDGDGVAEARLRVAVIVPPRVSNITDVDALRLEPGLDVAFVDDPRSLAGADVVLLPGTRSTLADLRWLRERGLAAAVSDHAARGGAVLGICGGFQMLGRSVADPLGVEGRAGDSDVGLGLLDVHTEFGPDKVLRLPSGTALGVAASGYEIHHGRVRVGSGDPFLGGARSGVVFGTMWHGSLEGDEFRRAWLTEVATALGRAGFRAGGGSFGVAREARVDALADAVEEHLDMAAIIGLIEHGPPADVPVLHGRLDRRAGSGSG